MLHVGLNYAVVVNALLLVVALVLVDANDYYKTLEVDKSASDRDIKKAFRKLALKYHPDKNSDPNAEEQFRTIAEAYEVLGDPQKRRQYDQGGSSFFTHQQPTGGHGGGGGGDGGFQFNFHEFFRDFDASFHAHRAGQKSQKTGGGFFNFDSFWDDDDDDLFNFKAFGMENFGESFFGSDHHTVHTMNHARAHAKNMKKAHAHEHMHTNNIHMHADASHMQSGSESRTCQTTTTRVGNTVSSQTICT